MSKCEARKDKENALGSTATGATAAPVYAHRTPRALLPLR